ncbi:MAG: aspartate aminotransferase family protein [Clostridia bacterium]|nr:aspartate aminotransferase family protein [Clostridia bacterium]
MNSITETDKKYIAGTYARFPVEVVSGKGSILIDSTGKEYIDMGTGIGVTAFGMCDEEWVNAVTAQLTKLQHTSNLYYTEPCAVLAKTLCERTGFKKVFFSNSGAEANECAIKAARKYASLKKGADCYKIITLENSFHGRTLTTLSATGQEHYHELFQPLTPGFIHTPANDIDKLKELLSENTIAAIMIECIQGEGGVNVLTDGYVKAVSDICKKEDIIFIVDEVQTGNGRTGELYSYMNYGVMPDIVTTAKGIGGGLPLGVCMLGERVESIFSFGDHGSTFGGNPVCCAGAINVIGRITDELLCDVKKKSKYMFDELTNAKGVKSVSGMGLMIGIETVKPASDIVKQCIEKGVLCLTAKNKVRLLPALNIPFDTLETAVEIIKEICAE